MQHCEQLAQSFIHSFSPAIGIVGSQHKARCPVFFLAIQIVSVLLYDESGTIYEQFLHSAGMRSQFRYCSFLWWPFLLCMRDLEVCQETFCEQRRHSSLYHTIYFLAQWTQPIPVLLHMAQTRKQDCN